MKPKRCDEPNENDDVAVGRVLVFDTTLRDGEQAPGFSLDRRAKLRMARMLEVLGVDVLEAGFPQASPDDFAAVTEIAGALQNTTVCGLARCVPGDIDTAGRALERARRSRIHLFLSTSPLHREHKLGMSRAQVLDTAVKAVEHAHGQAHEVEFSAEDATRTEWDFLAEVFSAVAAAGATTLNVPDTVGYTTPAEMAGLFRYLRIHVPGSDKLVFSGHCHDDLGMAVANSLAAVGAGARQLECTVNGIGERAGNAALEEVVMALKVRTEYFGLDTRVDTRKLYPASRLLTELTGHAVPRNKAVVGANAFAHESGIHQHGMLKHRGTYEIMRAEDVGSGESELVLGKHSGRAALRARLAALGQTPDVAAMDEIFARFKVLADRKREIEDADLDALAQGLEVEADGPWRITQLHASTHLGGGASASVRLLHADGHEVGEAALGTGLVEAVLRAIERADGVDLALAHFHLDVDGDGAAMASRMRLDARCETRDCHGEGSTGDLVEATACAALAIVNRLARQAPAAMLTASNPQGVTA